MRDKGRGGGREGEGIGKKYATVETDSCTPLAPGIDDTIFGNIYGDPNGS